jgi:hypothetical protein
MRGDDAGGPSAEAPEARPPISRRLRQDLENGQSVVADWLSNGCPECHAPLRIDFVVFQSGLPTLYPALLFHYGAFHKELAPPVAPHPEDEAALDAVIEYGVEADGKTRRRISYRQAIAEAARAWKPGLR